VTIQVALIQNIYFLALIKIILEMQLIKVEWLMSIPIKLIVCMDMNLMKRILIDMRENDTVGRVKIIE